ncbi:cation transporter [Streptococcus sp. X16XC17]|uniref:cation transporter n=1 Tax=unclassified Streptococcus TaxID=2608887 RepID=UPI00066FE03F|nr:MULTISPECIES: cation transporter [unclassified Streptococcus]TCD46623.1 cation transporter [Streptococcus sp. X16XC17]
MDQKKVEKQSLVVSVLINFLIGLSGLFIYVITDLNALLLDGIFSFIGFISSVAALYISKNSHRKTENFPNGLYFLEPLYGILKSIATLMLLIITLLETSATAYAYFAHGEGHPMVTGPVLPYTISMVILGFGLGIFNLHQNQKIQNMSTMIEAESRGNFIDGLISAGVGAAILLLNVIDINGQLGFLHYTGDFFITVILVIFSIKEPLSILIHSFREFTRSTVQNQEIEDQVMAILEHHLMGHMDDLDIHIFKQGIHIKVKIQILTVQDPDFIEQLAYKKAELLNQLRQEFNHLTLEFSF